MEINKNTFDPALLSFPDCDFLLAHAGEPPIVALREMPAICNGATCAQWINRFYELEELNKARGIEWAGIEAVKDSIKTYLKVREDWKKEEAFGAPRLPSLYVFDSRGHAHEGAPGADVGRVSTYFDESGNRKHFALHLTQGKQPVWKPKWTGKKPVEATTALALRYPEGKNCIECGIDGCGHTETYKPESRASFNAARARMSKHLRKAPNEQAAHLELHTLEFSQGTIK